MSEVQADKDDDGFIDTIPPTTPMVSGIYDGSEEILEILKQQNRQDLYDQYQKMVKSLKQHEDSLKYHKCKR